MTHEIEVRVYYEDTDLAGIVYYANYLKYIERGRSELLRTLGIDQGRLREEAGIVFAVRHLVADYRRPARFDDLLRVVTQNLKFSRSRLTMHQSILRKRELLFSADCVLVCLHQSGQAARIPQQLYCVFEAAGSE